MTKVFGPFSSNYRVWQTSRNNLLRSASWFDIFWGTYKNIILGPKRLLETKIFEKIGNLCSEKNTLG